MSAAAVLRERPALAETAPWEYRRLQVRVDRIAEVDSLLEECGRKGWELVAAVPAYSSQLAALGNLGQGGWLHLFMKRQTALLAACEGCGGSITASAAMCPRCGHGRGHS